MLMLIMLNMLLAIVMDFYTEVKASVGNAETLYSQSMELWKRFKVERQKQRLPLSTVLWVLDPTDLDADDEEGEEEVFLTPESFHQRICEAGMDKKLRAPTPEHDWLREQIDEILVNTDALQRENDREDVSLSDAFVCVQDMFERQKHLHYSMEQLVHLCTMMSDRCAPPTPVTAAPATPPLVLDQKKEPVAKVIPRIGQQTSGNVSNDEVVAALRRLVATKLPTMMESLLTTRVQPAIEVLRQSRDAVTERSEAMKVLMEKNYADLEVRAKQLAEELDMMRCWGDDDVGPLRRRRVSLSPSPWPGIHDPSTAVLYQNGSKDYNTVHSHSVPQGMS